MAFPGHRSQKIDNQKLKIIVRTRPVPLVFEKLMNHFDF